jgi:hypothetical protein
MEAVAPSRRVIALLWEIARTGFGYQQTKELHQAAGCDLIEDEVDLGYDTFEIGSASGQNFTRRFVVELSESGRPPTTDVSLFYFEALLPNALSEKRQRSSDSMHHATNEVLDFSR